MSEILTSTGKNFEFSRKFFQNKRKNCDKLFAFGSAFSRHAFVILGDEKLYGFGWNRFAQLGIGDTYNKLCCGFYHSLFQTSDNSIYSCGNNTSGKLCLGDFIDRKIPEKIPTFVVRDDDEVENIYVGLYHSVFLTKFMEVYSGGYNLSGQLGLGDKKSRANAKKIILPEKIISVTCGGYFTFFISINGNIFATGNNIIFDNETYYGDNVSTPVKILFFKDKIVLKIACGEFQSIFICSDNKVYVNGSNSCGELGIGNIERQTTPVLLSSLKKEKIISAKCGGFHTLFLSKKKMFFVGCNKKGALGNGKLENICSPFLFSIKNKKITQSLLLERSSLHFTKKEVFGSGSNLNGELLTEKFKLKKRSDVIPKVMKICDLEVKMRCLDNMKVSEMKERFEYLFLFKEDQQNFEQILNIF